MNSKEAIYIIAKYYKDTTKKPDEEMLTAIKTIYNRLEVLSTFKCDWEKEKNGYKRISEYAFVGKKMPEYKLLKEWLENDK